MLIGIGKKEHSLPNDPFGSNKTEGGIRVADLELQEDCKRDPRRGSGLSGTSLGGGSSSKTSMFDEIIEIGTLPPAPLAALPSYTNLKSAKSSSNTGARRRPPVLRRQKTELALEVPNISRSIERRRSSLPQAAGFIELKTLQKDRKLTTATQSRSRYAAAGKFIRQILVVSSLGEIAFDPSLF